MSPQDFITTLHVVCECSSTEHILQFVQFEPEEGQPEECCYTSVQLNPCNPWYKRVVMATKYVFGHQSRYGHWDCTILGKKEAEKLYVFLGKFLNKE